MPRIAARSEYAELLAWPKHILGMFEGIGINGEKRLTRHVDEVIFTTTHWSGMGTAEDALDYGIRQCLKECGQEVPDAPLVTHWAATDNDPACQAVIMERHHRPRHSFGDITRLIPDKMLKECILF